MSQVSLSCACGRVAGYIDTSGGRHIACHCADCKAWRAHLTRGREGGVEIFQTTPDKLTITAGHEHIRCSRLSEKGLLRWSASCCNTALANTLPTAAMPFVGVLTDMIADKAAIGPVASIVNRAEPPGNQSAGASSFEIIKRALAARITGKERRAPFFKADGSPIVEPVVLG